MNNFIIPHPLIIPNNNAWTIYTKSNCKYCKLVKELLEKHQIILTINCDDWIKENENKYVFLAQMQNIIKQTTNPSKETVHNTFPMVFNNGTFIGGYMETLKFLESQTPELNFGDDF